MCSPAERDIQLLKNRNAVLAKKNSSRDRLINELKEGAKILEDQLRLMDEKYIELRNKLDWTRQHSQKEVRRIQVRQQCVLSSAGPLLTLPPYSRRRRKPHDCVQRCSCPGQRTT